VRVVDVAPVGVIILNVQVTTSAMDNSFQCQPFQNPINVVDCTGSLDPGANVMIDVKVFMTADAGTQFTNVATVDPDDLIVEADDPNDLNNSSGVTVSMLQPDYTLQMQKTFDPVSPGQNEIYTLNIANAGTADGGTVKVEDVLPSSLTFVSANPTNGFTCTNSSGTVDCTGDLGVGASAQIQITARVNAGVTGSITNSATINPGFPIAESNTSNNTDSKTVSVGGTGLNFKLVSNTDSPDPVAQGGLVTYTIIGANTGTADATGVQLQDTLDPGVNFVAAQGTNGWTCTGTGPVNCTGNLAAGTTTTITVQVIVNAVAGTTLTNTATINPGFVIAEDDHTDNVGSATTTVGTPSCSKCVQIVLAPITTSASSVKANDTLTYTLVVSNTGDSDGAVDINDMLDANVTLMGTPTITGGVGMTCSVCSGSSLDVTGTILHGTGVIITITVTVNSGVTNPPTTSISNTESVTITSPPPSGGNNFIVNSPTSVTTAVSP
jgi:uncharacterized repeat protein (TIGR01451 family)